MQAQNKQLQAEIKKARKKAKKGGFWKTMGRLGTSIAGGLLGGPAGAVTGAAVEIFNIVFPKPEFNE